MKKRRKAASAQLPVVYVAGFLELGLGGEVCALDVLEVFVGLHLKLGAGCVSCFDR